MKKVKFEKKGLYLVKIIVRIQNGFSQRVNKSMKFMFDRCVLNVTHLRIQPNLPNRVNKRQTPKSDYYWEFRFRVSYCIFIVHSLLMPIRSVPHEDNDPSQHAMGLTGLALQGFGAFCKDGLLVQSMIFNRGVGREI